MVMACKEEDDISEVHSAIDEAMQAGRNPGLRHWARPRKSCELRVEPAWQYMLTLV